MIGREYPTQNYEEWLAFITAHLPEPVSQELVSDGSMLLMGGDPGQVIVRLTRSTVTVLEYAARREELHTPGVTPRRVGSVVWRRVPNARAVAAVHALIDAARDARLAKFRTCERCAQSTPPESMHDDAVCQSCAALPRAGRPGDVVGSGGSGGR